MNLETCDEKRFSVWRRPSPYLVLRSRSTLMEIEFIKISSNRTNEKLNSIFKIDKLIGWYVYYIHCIIRCYSNGCLSSELPQPSRSLHQRRVHVSQWVLVKSSSSMYIDVREALPGKNLYFKYLTHHPLRWQMTAKVACCNFNIVVYDCMAMLWQPISPCSSIDLGTVEVRWMIRSRRSLVVSRRSSPCKTIQAFVSPAPGRRPRRSRWSRYYYGVGLWAFWCCVVCWLEHWFALCTCSQ